MQKNHPSMVPPIERDRLLLKADEAASLLSISPRTLWQLTQNGEIRCVRIGRSVRYAPADLDAYIAARKGVNHVEA